MNIAGAGAGGGGGVAGGRAGKSHRELAELRRAIVAAAKSRGRARVGGGSGSAAPADAGAEGDSGTVFHRENGRVVLVCAPERATVETCSVHDRAHLRRDGAWRLVPASRLNGEARPRLYPPDQMLTVRDQEPGAPERVLGRANFEAACDELHERRVRLAGWGFDMGSQLVPMGLFVREAMARGGWLLRVGMRGAR